jgi:hypothetical protein
METNEDFNMLNNGVNAWHGGSLMESHSYFCRVLLVEMDVVINICFNLLIDN